MKRLISLLLVMGVVAAACGGDDDTTGTADDPVDPPSADDTDEPAADDTADDTTADGADDADDDGPVELTDSFRGVTASTIKIGVGSIDGSAFGFDSGDREGKWAAAVDHVNANGGVLGREIEMVFSTYGPLGATEAEAACVRHTEDEEVFAFVGSAREDNVLCYTELNDTIAINGLTIADSQIERSEVLLLSTGEDNTAQLFSGIEQLGDEGYFTDRNVAISYDEGAGDDRTLLRDALEGFGASVVAETELIVENNDTIQAASDLDVAAQRWISDGATAVVAIGNNVNSATIGAVGRSGAEMDVVTKLIDVGQIERLGHDPTAVGGTIFGFSPPTNLELFEAGESGVPECVERFEAFSGETVIPDPGPDEISNLNPTITACRAIELFAAIATAAGAHLTNDSFTAAALSLGDVELTGVSSASVGPDKFRASDALPQVLVYDAAANSFVSR